MQKKVTFANALGRSAMAVRGHLQFGKEAFMGVKPHPAVVAIVDWYPCDFQKSLEKNWKLIADKTEKSSLLDL